MPTCRRRRVRDSKDETASSRAWPATRPPPPSVKRDGQFLGQPFQLAVELMQCKSSAEVEACKARLNVRSIASRSGMNRAGSILHAPSTQVDGLPSTQRIRNQCSATHRMLFPERPGPLRW